MVSKRITPFVAKRRNWWNVSVEDGTLYFTHKKETVSVRGQVVVREAVGK